MSLHMAGCKFKHLTLGPAFEISGFVHVPTYSLFLTEKQCRKNNSVSRGPVRLPSSML